MLHFGFWAKTAAFIGYNPAVCHVFGVCGWFSDNPSPQVPRLIDWALFPYSSASPFPFWLYPRRRLLCSFGWSKLLSGIIGRRSVLGQSTSVFGFFTFPLSLFPKFLHGRWVFCVSFGVVTMMPFFFLFVNTLRDWLCLWVVFKPALWLMSLSALTKDSASCYLSDKDNLKLVQSQFVAVPRRGLSGSMLQGTRWWR